MSSIRAATVNNVTYEIGDAWDVTATVASGTPNTITFQHIDDLSRYGYEVYIYVTSSSTNKSPYTKLKTIVDEETNDMTLIYETDADAGATAKLRAIR